ERFEFDLSGSGTGSFSDNFGERTFTWSIVNDEMTIIPDGEETTTSFVNVSTLIEEGVADPTLGQQFIDVNGDFQIETTYTLLEANWRLAQDTSTVDRFVERTSYNVQIVDEQTRIDLRGDALAPPVQVDYDDGDIYLTERASLTPIAFNAVDIPGDWALVAGSNPNATSGSFLSTADLATFNVDNTGSTLLFGRTFTWQVDADGALVMTFDDDSTVIRHELLNQFADNAMGVLSETTTPAGEDYTGYTLVLKRDAQASIDPLTGGLQFLMNSFTLTNPDAYDANGNVFWDAYFGWRFEADGTLKNIWSGDVNFGQTYWAGWTPWYWSTEADNTVVLESRITPNGPYSLCDLASTDCNRDRVRKWIPLGQVGGRIYVLEWESANLNKEVFPSGAEDLVYSMAPRVQFYELFDLDQDGDGTPDSQDTDIDGDTYANEVDAEPENPDVW
ncbi:MAG: hypothetical protein HUJ31_03395, partial [Pseudomonadales bacterium]|nr:hypothetical protein [Pseudomonadales bacterium]